MINICIYYIFIIFIFSKLFYFILIKTFSNGGLNQGNPFHPGDSFFNPFGTMFNQPPPRRQPGAAGADPDEERHQENDVQNYILSAIIFFVIFSVFTSLMFNF